MNISGRIDWRLCRRQAAFYPLAAMTFSTSDLFRVFSQGLLSLRPVLMLTEAYLAWFAAGLLLAATAQRLHAAPGRLLWRGALIVVVAATLNGPVNDMLASVLLDLVQPVSRVSPSIYLLWQGTLCGGLFFGYCLLVQRSRDRRASIARAELERANTEARLRDAQTRALEQRIDPALLERSLGALRTAYTHDRAAGEELLGALVEVLRLAVPATYGGAPAADNDGVLRAWKNLRERLETHEPMTPITRKGES